MSRIHHAIKILLFFAGIAITISIASCGTTTPTSPTSSEDRSGTWTISPTIAYDCAAGALAYSISSITISDTNPSISVTIMVTVGVDTIPITLTGTFSSGNNFSTSTTISADISSVTYSIVVVLGGTFTGATSFAGNTSLDFDSALEAIGCNDKNFVFTGTIV